MRGKRAGMGCMLSAGPEDKGTMAGGGRVVVRVFSPFFRGGGGGRAWPEAQDGVRWHSPTQALSGRLQPCPAWHTFAGHMSPCQGQPPDVLMMNPPTQHTNPII